MEPIDQEKPELDASKIVAIVDFVAKNREPLAHWLRLRLIDAGAKDYVSRLGKDGIEAMRRDAAGMLLDLACALMRRVEPSRKIDSETILMQLPERERASIRLPRSEEYYEVLEWLKNMQKESKE
jgi:hypothetical protein